MLQYEAKIETKMDLKKNITKNEVETTNGIVYENHSNYRKRNFKRIKRN